MAISQSVRPTIEIVPQLRSVLIDGVAQQIGARAFDVLVCLHEHSGHVVSKKLLLESVWEDLAVEESNLTVQIAALRKLLGPRSISTVPGVGYQLTLDPSSAVEGSSEALPLPPVPSIAVLPFSNLTGEPARDHLVDGIVTELIVALSRIPAIFVISATSTFALRGQPVDLRDVGLRLGVRYILEGAIQGGGEQIRITTYLVEVESGRTIWSDRVSGLRSDLFALEDHLCEVVAAAIEPNLLDAEAHRANSKPTRNLQAYDLCMQAMPHVNRLTSFENFGAARNLLERAIELDPNYLRAKAFICRLAIVARSARWLSMDEAAACIPLAEEVVSDPSKDALALAFAGLAIAFLGRQPQRGANILKQAFVMNQNSSHVLNASGWAHAYVGDYPTAIDHFTRSIRLSPLDPIIGQVRGGLGIALVLAGRVEEGVAALERAHAEAPEYTSSYMGLTIGYWVAGQHDAVESVGRLLRQRDPKMTISMTLRDSPFRAPNYQRAVTEALRFIGVPE